MQDALEPKIVVALYPFKAIEGGDLTLEKVSDRSRDFPANWNIYLYQNWYYFQSIK